MTSFYPLVLNQFRLKSKQLAESGQNTPIATDEGIAKRVYVFGASSFESWNTVGVSTQS